MSSHSHDCAQDAVQTDASSEGLAMEERLTRQVFDGPRGQVTIDDLSDDVLLEIFDFYLDDKDPNEPCSIDKWHPLVHVCRWWRSVVFSSPRRLDLRLLCTGDRSVGAMLDIWPALPIAIVYDRRSGEMVLKNIIAALEHPDRVFHINIYNFHFPGTWEALTGAMQVPFPELTYLRLQSVYPYEAALPAGSAPRLRTLKLNYVPFSVVRDLLLSAGDLVDLSLCKVDLSEYASPKSIVACLSPFRRLESLHLEIAGCPNRQSLPPQARAILPVLTKFSFEGVNMYLEDFVARIDAPVLSQLNVSMKLVSHHVFDISRLRQFIGRARRLEPFRAASVCFESKDSWSIVLEFPPHGSTLRIERMDLPYLPSMAMVCNQLSPLISHVERLEILRRYSRDVPREQFFMDSRTDVLIRSFTAIQGLYVTKTLVPAIKSTLQEHIRDRQTATGVLPNLCDLFLGGGSVVIFESDRDVIQPLVDARQLSGQPVTIHFWEEDRAYN